MRELSRGAVEKSSLRYSDVAVALAATDAASWFIATIAVVVARYDFELSAVQWQMALSYASLAALIQVAVGLPWRFRTRTGVGSFIEAWTVLLVSTIAGGITALTMVVTSDEFPHGFAILVPPMAILTMMAVRFLARAGRLRHTQVRVRNSDSTPVLIYGAGNAGQQLGRMLFEDLDAPYRVVGFIDDDPARRGRVFEFGSVVGNGSELVDKVREHDASAVIMAMTDPAPELITATAEALDAAGVTMLLLPPVGEIVTGRIKIGDVEPFDVSDLLGRRPILTDISEAGTYLRGRRVLITGAGGSIGAEIAKQVHQLGPSELACLDRDESALHSVQLALYGVGLLDTPDMVLCDIRDADALRRVFEEHRPEIVFHAAALKHLPMLEQYPEEGWKTNVLGSLNVLRLSREFGVERYVNISTDKAADPTSVLGLTKRFAERLTAWFASGGETYVSVRFGNVLGSRGSVLHTFMHQVRSGGPVTVVDPDITRYFMTIPEACQLVIQAGAIGEPGEVMVFDMGEPVRILDMAQQLIRGSGRGVEIVFTGLREGEKLHEVLFSETEAARPTSHPLISGVPAEPLDPARLCPTYHDATSGGIACAAAVGTGRAIAERTPVSSSPPTPVREIVAGTGIDATVDAGFTE